MSNVTAEKPDAKTNGAAAVLPQPSPRDCASLEVENWIQAYEQVAEWIRFADAKAAVVLTVAGALIGLLLPTLKPWLDAATIHPAPWWPRLAVGLFTVWIVTLVVAGSIAFRCIIPFTQKGRHPALERCTHFHPAGISAKYGLGQVDEFIGDCRVIRPDELMREVMAGLLIDSHISAKKYRCVSGAIRWLAVSVVFAFLYVVAIQF